MSCNTLPTVDPGTPSGVTLAPEGGAHQSITTPSLGISGRRARRPGRT
ncbi:hypothetical protein [Streptomyces sp. A012304]|nr:hypothetical protein [Streptomyces sp. A012304]